MTVVSSSENLLYSTVKIFVILSDGGEWGDYFTTFRNGREQAKCGKSWCSKDAQKRSLVPRIQGTTDPGLWITCFWFFDHVPNCVCSVCVLFVLCACYCHHFCGKLGSF